MLRVPSLTHQILFGEKVRAAIEAELARDDSSSERRPRNLA